MSILGNNASDILTIKEPVIEVQEIYKKIAWLIQFITVQKNATYNCFMKGIRFIIKLTPCGQTFSWE